MEGADGGGAWTWKADGADADDDGTAADGGGAWNHDDDEEAADGVGACTVADGVGACTVDKVSSRLEGGLGRMGMGRGGMGRGTLALSCLVPAKDGVAS